MLAFDLGSSVANLAAFLLICAGLSYYSTNIVKASIYARLGKSRAPRFVWAWRLTAVAVGALVGYFLGMAERSALAVILGALGGAFNAAIMAIAKPILAKRAQGILSNLALSEEKVKNGSKHI
jgi:hypothetical protein